MRELKDYVATWDGALTPGACSGMIQTFHSLAAYHQPNGAGIRPGLEDSSWVELDVSRHADDAFKSFMDSQIKHHFEAYKARIGLRLSISPIRRLSPLIMKHYQASAGQRFQLHFDSLGDVCNRYLVFLWYLNDVAAGGETTFPDLGISVAPRAGRLLMFPPYWMYQHAAPPPQSGDKYIISTYALY
ncbi:MAG: 2OG-Fe(II) oxygenase [Steroidobacteraceae bacterium]